MNKSGPIVIIEDDLDDQNILELVFKELAYENEVVFFSDAFQALDFLRNDGVHPFIVLSDLNMPKVNGFELRRAVHTNEELASKCIPYLFFTTSASEKAVSEAYKMSVQGFFVKPTKYEDLRNTMRTIIEYWQKCYSPARYGQFYTEQKA
jgi:DNA-binding NtrC family response regulator